MKLNLPPAEAPKTGAAVAAHGRMGPVVLLGWAHFLNDGAANYLPGILPALLAALAIPVRYAGAVIAILVVGQALQPMVGVLSDRWGGRVLTVAGLAGTSLGAAWVGWARSPASLVAALCLVGVANSCFHPPALASVRRFAGGSGERAIATFLVGGEIGRGAWPLLASIVVTALGLHALWVMSLAAAATLPWIWFKARPQPRLHAASHPWHAIRDAGRPLAVLVSYSSLRAAMMFGVAAFVPLLWRERGGRLIGGAALITVMLLVGIIGNLGAAFLAEHLGRRRLVVIGTAAACALLALFLLSSGVWLWLSMAGVGIALFATLPLTVLMGQDLLPRNHSLGSGFALGFSNALGALGVALLGLTAAHWGPTGVLWTFEACGLAALALAWFLPLPPRGEPET